MAINIVSQKWYGKAKRPTDVYIGRPSLLGNPFASKPSKIGQQLNLLEWQDIPDYWLWLIHNHKRCTIRVGSDQAAVELYQQFLRKLYQHDAEVRNELKRLARLSQDSGTLHLICWCKLKVNDDTPCHGDVIKAALEGLIVKHLV